MFKKSINDEKNWISRRSLRWMGAGIEFCGVLGVFCYFGYRLDKRCGTTPIYMIMAFFIAFIGMLYLFYKDSKKD